MKTAMFKLDNAYINIEEQIKKGFSSYKHSRQLIDSLLEDLNDVLSKIMIRHIFESSWFGKHIKQLLSHTDVNVDVKFSSKFSPLLDQFSGIIRHQLQIVESTSLKSANQPIISKKRTLSMTKLYRVTFSLSFMLKFWSNSANIQYQMTSTDMKKWIKDDKMNSDCSLNFRLEMILVISSKSDYIDRDMNVWDEEQNNKMLMWMTFVIVARFVALIRLLLITKPVVYITNITIVYQLAYHWKNRRIFSFWNFKQRASHD